MLEKAIEARFVKECKARGALCLKQNITRTTGYPDRLVITKEGKHVWVELKTEKGALSERQKIVIEELKSRNVEVYVAYGLEQALVIANLI